MPLILLFIALFITSCATTTDNAKTTDEPAKLTTPEQTIEQLYQQAHKAWSDGVYSIAAEKFMAIESQFPHSDWLDKVMLMQAHSLYSDFQYEATIFLLNKFRNDFPAHPHLDYTYYLEALCHYEQIQDVSHDQSYTQKSLTSLQRVQSLFPNSKYAKDARYKEDLTIDFLAAKEMDVGRFYQNKSNHTAAISRFNYVVKFYDTTNHIQEALYRLVESNTALGLTNEAKQNAKILGYNYPDSQWYKLAYKLITDE
jgi:outer membrane protein assembly factor BamD